MGDKCRLQSIVYRIIAILIFPQFTNSVNVTRPPFIVVLLGIWPSKPIYAMRGPCGCKSGQINSWKLHKLPHTELLRCSSFSIDLIARLIKLHAVYCKKRWVLSAARRHYNVANNGRIYNELASFLLLISKPQSGHSNQRKKLIGVKNTRLNFLMKFYILKSSWSY